MRSPWSKHLWNLVSSGFYTRGLDADDHAFLETVRERGIANGELPRDNAVLIEELDFWSMPYAVDSTVVRRQGPLAPKPPRAKLVSNWHVRRAQNDYDRAAAKAEYEREQLEWLAAQNRRELREITSNFEWEAAAPKLKFGRVEGRYYVPQWKVDQENQLAEVRKQMARKMRAARRARQKAKEEMQRAEQAKLAAERRAAEAKAAAARAEKDVGLRNGFDSESLKRVILERVRNTNGQHHWTLDLMMQATGCYSRDFVQTCLRELVRDGRLVRTS